MDEKIRPNKTASEKQKEFAKNIADVLNLKLSENDSRQEYWKFVNNYIELYKKQICNSEIDVFVPGIKSKGRKKIISLINKCGVYMLWSDNNLVYIGKSINLSERIMSSIEERRKKVKITSFSYYETKTQADMHILEPYLIVKYKPLLNSEFVAPDYSELFYIELDIAKLKRYEV